MVATSRRPDPLASEAVEHLAELQLEVPGWSANAVAVFVTLAAMTEIEAFALELNDMPFARGLSNQAVTVPRLGEARLRVVASTTLLDLVQQVLILGERSDLSYRIEGVVYLRGAARRKLPYETSGRLRLLPAQPNERTLVPL